MKESLPASALISNLPTIGPASGRGRLYFSIRPAVALCREAKLEVLAESASTATEFAERGRGRSP
jgi:hypothetical protein